MMAQFYRLVVSVALAVSLGPGGMAEDAAPLVAVTGGARIMGAAWKIKVYSSDSAAGEAAIKAALAEVERLDKVLSDYEPESELSRLSATAATDHAEHVSDDLWRVLVAADEFRMATDGAFDITVGPLTTLWRQSRRSGKLPREDKLSAARAAIGPGSLVLDAATMSVQLARPGMRLDPGGIGMGYAADRALEILEAQGITAAMIDASGDILVSGPPPGADGWRIMVAPLRAGGDGEVIVLSHAAVTTSGDAYQAVEIDGVRYSHIVDPRTGLGVRGPAAVTVVARAPDDVVIVPDPPLATTADALATAASVLGSTDGPAVIAKYPGVSARFMWRENATVCTLVTPGWPASAVAPEPAP